MARCSLEPLNPSLPRRSSSFYKQHKMFDSLRRKMSRNSSTPESNTTLSSASSPRPRSFMPKSNNMNNNDPFSSAAPPTRRPNRPGMNAFSTPSNEPPPAYTPNPEPINMSAGEPWNPNPHLSAKADDQYSFLSTFDTKFLIDDSGSMAGRSWRETQKALEIIAPICTAHDEDGVDIHFLNEPKSYLNVKQASDVTRIFTSVKPQGGTPTGQRLNQLLRTYLKEAVKDPEATKPLNIIVITDGAPSDDVETVIIGAARKLDQMDALPWQVGIQFFQVGNEPEARGHLQHLDDNLAGVAGDAALRDMVDTVPFTGSNGGELTAEGLLKVVLGAVNRKLDRKRSGELHR